jgi:uncharacterized membrane protein YqiK
VASRSDVVSVTPVIIVLVVGMIIINWWWVRAISREFSHGLALELTAYVGLKAGSRSIDSWQVVSRPA